MDNADILSTIRERRSVHRFLSEPVAWSAIETVLEAGRWAPSRFNTQPWQFIVIQDPETRGKISQIIQRFTIAWEGVVQAPYLICTLVDPAMDDRHFVEAGAVATQNMALMATSLGLSTYWIGLLNGYDKPESAEAEIARLLAVPKGYRIISLLPVGKPAYKATGERKKLEHLVHFETHGNKVRAS